jgi:hypothetical protein
MNYFVVRSLQNRNVLSLSDGVPVERCQVRHEILGEVPSDAQDRVHADEVVVLTGECTNTM